LSLLKYVVKGLPVLVSLVAIGFLVKFSGLGNLLDESWIDSAVRGRGLAGEMLFLGVGAAATAVGMPRQVVAFMAGYAFGFVQGSLLGTLASLLGCALAFYYARLLGRGLVARRFAGKVGKMDAFIRDNPFSMTMLIRLLPVGSNLVTNLAAGVTSVAFMPFLLGSGLGYLPQNAIFALVGSGIDVDPVWRIGLGVLLFAISGILGVVLYRRMRHGKSYDEALDRDIAD
jgi:uncharacterized membrane protein YdjX (TVP38/TMEM64 family)